MKCYVEESASTKIHCSVKTCIKMYGNQGVTVLTWYTAVLKDMEMLEILLRKSLSIWCVALHRANSRSGPFPIEIKVLHHEHYRTDVVENQCFWS